MFVYKAIRTRKCSNLQYQTQRPQFLSGVILPRYNSGFTGFTYVLLCPQSIKLAFFHKCHLEICSSCDLSLGITSAPEIFQCEASELLQGLEGSERNDILRDKQFFYNEF